VRDSPHRLKQRLHLAVVAAHELEGPQAAQLSVQLANAQGQVLRAFD
jgi:hypothetical protein